MAGLHENCTEHVTIERGVVYCPRTRIVYANMRIGQGKRYMLGVVTSWDIEWVRNVLASLLTSHPYLDLVAFTLVCGIEELSGMTDPPNPGMLGKYYMPQPRKLK